jgi:hypothetical protein
MRIVTNALWYVRNTTIHKDMRIPFVTETHIYVIIQHLYFTQTPLSVTFHNTCHPTYNIEASRENATQTSSHNTRRKNFEL